MKTIKTKPVTEGSQNSVLVIKMILFQSEKDLGERVTWELNPDKIQLLGQYHHEVKDYVICWRQGYGFKGTNHLNTLNETCKINKLSTNDIINEQDLVFYGVPSQTYGFREITNNLDNLTTTVYNKYRQEIKKIILEYFNE